MTTLALYQGRSLRLVTKLFCMWQFSSACSLCYWDPQYAWKDSSREATLHAGAAVRSIPWKRLSERGEFLPLTVCVSSHQASSTPSDEVLGVTKHVWVGAGISAGLTTAFVVWNRTLAPACRAVTGYMQNIGSWSRVARKGTSNCECSYLLVLNCGFYWMVCVMSCISACILLCMWAYWGSQ